MIQERFHIAKAAINMTLACNLKCRLCQTYAPYYKKPYHPSLEILCRQMERFFQIVTSVDQLCFSGGEFFIRQDAPEILGNLYKYNDCILKEILVISNGSIVPSAETVTALKRFGDKVKVIVDYYGASLSPAAGDIMEVLQDIKKEYRDQTNGKYFGGWIDFRNIELRYTEEEAAKKFLDCADAQKWRTIILTEGGKIYPCERLKWVLKNGISIKDDEFVDIYDESETIDEKRRKIRGFYQKHFSSCLRCDGLRDNLPRYEAAEQMTTEEYNSLKLLD